MNRKLDIAAPLLFGLGGILLWQAAVRLTGTPKYVVPAPSDVVVAYADGFSLLNQALLSTLVVTFWCAPPSSPGRWRCR
jgi:ABC-type nitrate/sulfonate/bicarbonate transport system permease component